MSTGRWHDGRAADKSPVQQGANYAGSGMLIETLHRVEQVLGCLLSKWTVCNYFRFLSRRRYILGIVILEARGRPYYENKNPYTDLPGAHTQWLPDNVLPERR